jgi:hypothetical protein
MNEANVRPLSTLDDDLSRRFHSAAEVPFEPDWAAVVRRASQLTVAPVRSRHVLQRALTVAVVLAALVAAASPAFGLHRIFLDFLGAERAPEHVQVEFGKLDALDPEHGPGATTSETRTVHIFRTPSGNYDLTVSPAKDGFCWGVSGFGMTCENSHSHVIDPFYRDIPAAGQTSEPALITGAVHSLALSRVTITFEDGDTADLPLVVVSEPVGATFFLYEVPQARWTLGLRPATIAAYNSAGAVLGSALLRYTSAR